MENDEYKATIIQKSNSLYEVLLQLSMNPEDKKATGNLSKLIEERISELAKIIPDNIYGFEEDSMAGNIGKILKEKGLTVSTAESCTGGNIAHFFTLNPGSSEYFKGGVVTYSNDLKTKLLGVDPETIAAKGAVSKEVVEAMAINARRLMGTDYAIATSGIAGPDGGTPEKPVGTVWIAVAGAEFVVSKVLNFGNHRERNIIRSSQAALNMLRLILQ